MTVTADLRPNSPLPAGMLSNPDLTRLYMSASCPELKAESVVSSEFTDDESEGRFEPLSETPEEQDGEGPFSMDCPDAEDEEDEADGSSVEEPATEPAVARAPYGPVEPPAAPPLLCGPCAQPSPEVHPEVPPSVSSLSSSSGASSSAPSDRRKLRWVFKGLTLWVELEEFDSDLTNAVESLSARRSSPPIPRPHATAIYGMTHLSVPEARRLLKRVPSVLPSGAWPSFPPPVGMTCDVAVCGRPGQVCSIAWTEFTLATSPDHEDAMDALHRLFFGEGWDAPGGRGRDRPWKPHASVAYDNPEENELSLLDAATYAAGHPTLLGRGRRVEALSLWRTEGTMEEWECVDRVRFW